MPKDDIEKDAKKDKAKRGSDPDLHDLLTEARDALDDAIEALGDRDDKGGGKVKDKAEKKDKDRPTDGEKPPKDKGEDAPKAAGG